MRNSAKGKVRVLQELKSSIWFRFNDIGMNFRWLGFVSLLVHEHQKKLFNLEYIQISIS